jgi:mono/diheme cytochrome c family protein
MNKRHSLIALAVALLLGAGMVIAQSADKETIERGKYLVVIAGCNDCHTAGYLASEGKTPEEQWLTGDNFGWRGPWGTTYGANLRIVVQALSEDQWVTLAKNLTARPTMPWFALRKMKDEDLRAIYQYIRHLGPGGEPAPAYVPPDQEPDPPYALFPPPPPE